MKPNFALLLSFEGIVLLQRSAAGWRRLGTVDPAAATLAEEMAALHRTATALAPGGVRCKLVIPDNQIRYMTIETPGAEFAEREEAARAALEGATPYAVSELVFDIEADGDRTHIAAVARETLAEAEHFAAAHSMNPVSFAAMPGESAFVAEPFFGETEAAQELLEPGETVEREATAVTLSAEPESPPDGAHAPGLTERIAQEAPVAAEAQEPDTASETTEDLTEADGSEEPGFVSRRRVPMFRNDPPRPSDATAAASGSVPGFGETAAEFAGDANSRSAPRRHAPKPDVLPAPSPVVRRPESEAERFTIYGAPTANGSSGRMGATGLAILVGVVLVAGIAAFASGPMSSQIAGFFSRLTEKEPTAQFTTPLQPQASATAGQDKAAPAPDVELISLESDLTDEDAAVLDALRAPIPQETLAVPDMAPSPEDLRAAYAVTGIWPVAPDVPSPPPLVNLEDLYVTSIDPINPNFDAVALPEPTSQQHDLDFLAPPSPAPAGTRFTLDERGMVVPTEDGSMNPDGIMVFAGPPPARQPSNLLKIEDPGEDLSARLRLAGFRPQARPEDLIETAERATFSGLTRSELSEFRPRLRPQSAQENARATASLVPLEGGAARSLLEQPEENDFENATARAVAASLRPDARPKGFEKTVEQATASAPAPTTASVAPVTPRDVTPKIPSSASATRQATVKNAINLRQVNLIGVYGKPSSRRALVRLENGRYRKVKVGDRIDGGRVSAIGDAELRYQKSGRSITLKMPRG